MNRKKRTGQILLLACILALGSGTWGCAQGTGRQAVSPGQGTAVQEKQSPEKPAMESRPIAFTDRRRRLIREYGNHCAPGGGGPLDRI